MEIAFKWRSGAIFLLALLVCNPLAAEGIDQPNTLEGCAKVDDSLARLQCYDRLVGVSPNTQKVQPAEEESPTIEPNRWKVEVIESDSKDENVVVISTPAMMWIGETCAACQSRLEVQCLAGIPSVIFRSPIDLGKGELIFEAQHDSRHFVEQRAYAIDKGKGAVLMSPSTTELTKHLFIHERFILKLNRPKHPISAQFLIGGLEQAIMPYAKQCGLVPSEGQANFYPGHRRGHVYSEQHQNSTG
ncbi:MAG TPA: hypothetical protein DCZ03_00685 [Gammaproteobacteria bacterium]|nr:hypothetical protein [Gammaproteobacteria bacterium]